MVHHKGDILLGETIQRSSLGDDTPDHGMVVLRSAFLVRGLWVTVKDTCPAAALRIRFQCRRIGKLTPVVRKHHLEQPAEGIRLQFPIEAVEDVNDGLRGIGIPDESQHELWHCKMQGQKNLTPFLPFYGVHFDDGKARMFFHECEKILVGAPDATLFVHLEAVLLFPALSKAYNPRHVKVFNGKDAALDIIVQGAFVNHDFICMTNAYMVEGLTFYDQWADQGIQPQGFLLGKLDPLPGFGTNRLIFLLRMGS